MINLEISIECAVTKKCKVENKDGDYEMEVEEIIVSPN